VVSDSYSQTNPSNIGDDSSEDEAEAPKTYENGGTIWTLRDPKFVKRDARTESRQKMTFTHNTSSLKSIGRQRAQ